MVVAEQPSAEQNGVVERTAILELCSDNKQNLHRPSVEQPSHNF